MAWSPPTASRLKRLIGRLSPLALVVFAVGFNLWVLKAETTSVQNLNDSSWHLELIRWAAGRIEDGHVPLDGWFPYLTLGWPQFHHTHSLPYILTAYLGVAVGTHQAYLWTLYLLLALWPICTYWGLRLLGWNKWHAAAAALVSPVLISTPNYGYEHGSYVWQGYGVQSQLWGMWLLPIALGLSWRAVSQNRFRTAAALAVGLTITAHLLEGYLALLSLGLWVLLTPREILGRIGRALLVGIGGLAASAWLLVPLLTDAKWGGGAEFFQNTVLLNSHGAKRVLVWLVTGEIYDAGRFPVVTLLVFAGVLICVTRFRRDERARAALAFWVLSLLLFFGPASFGQSIKLLPFSGSILFHRFIAGVHLGGIILAGIGAASLGQLVVKVAQRLPKINQPAAAVVMMILGILFLFPAWGQVSSYDQRGADLIRYQQLQELSDGRDLRVLIDQIKSSGAGRVYAGMTNNWGRDYKIGHVPVYTVLANSDLDAIGFLFRLGSISTDIEARFDETNLLHYNLFNVKYILMPETRRPSVTATLLARQGRHTLWQVGTTGYLHVVDTTEAIVVNRSPTMGREMARILESPQLRLGAYPTVSFAGSPPGPITSQVGATLTSPPGLITLESVVPADGIFSGRVLANRPAVVLLKSSYHPRWRATMDGVRVPTFMVAPSFVGALVPPGDHSVGFTYVPYPHYPGLLALAGLVLFGLYSGPKLKSMGILSRLRKILIWRSS